MNVVRKTWSNRDWLRQTESQPYGRGRTAGARIEDLAALEKAIQLCMSCARKFNARAFEYAKHKLMSRYDFVISDCDGCRDKFVKCVLFTKRGV